MPDSARVGVATALLLLVGADVGADVGDCAITEWPVTLAAANALEPTAAAALAMQNPAGIEL